MRSRSNHRPLRFALDVLVVMALAAIAIGCSMRRQFSAAALNPSSDFDLMPADLGLEAETVWVAGEGAALHLWIFHARQPVATVVFCNGNSGNKGVLLPLIPAIIERGYDAVLFDYRGFGLSSGDADVYSLADDTIRVVDLVRSRAPAQPLALLGTSLGSVAAIVTAKERPDAVDALVLESLLDSRASCRSMLGPVAGPITCRQLVPAQFDTRKQLSQLRQPVLVLHGDEDQLTPLRPAARMLAHGAGGGQPREFWLAEGAGHSPDLIGKYGPIYRERIDRFLESYLTRRRSPDPAPSWSFARGGKAGEASGAKGSGVVQVRFPSAIEPTDSELPVEVFVVPRRGTPTVWRRWLPIDRAGALQVPVSSQPLIVSGQVVRLPVDRSGDGWVPRALVPERALRAAERRLKELLQTDLPALAVQRHGVPLAAADRRGARGGRRVRFDPGPPERRARLAAELSALRTEIAGLDVSQAPRERQARQFQLLADLGGAFELIGDRAAARELYHQAIARLPQRSETIVLYQDAGWSVGVAWVLDLLLHRLIELAENEPERSGWIARLGTIEHQRDQRQIALERWWEEQAATAPDAASGASADDRPGS